MRRLWTRLVIFTRDFSSRLGILRETATRETNILISRMFTNPSCDHAQQSFVKVCYKPCNVLRTCFPRPKDKPSALQCRGVVYKVGCVECNFVYYGQTDRALETRLKEHKRAVRVGDNNFKVAQHANQFVHSIDFDRATIVDKARNFHQRVFLEAWY